MTNQRGSAEARLLHVERALEQITGDLREHQRALNGVAQDVWALWMDSGSLAMVSSGTGTATYSGTLATGCGGLSGQTITIKSAGGATLGTCTTGLGGAFSGSVTITSPSESVTVNAAVSGYAPTSQGFMFTVGSNSLGTVTVGSGGVSISVCGGLCLQNSLPFTDSLYGSGTLVSTGGNWTGTINAIVPAAGGCAGATVPIAYELFTNGNLQLNWPINNNTAFCPVAVGITASSGGVGTTPNCSASPVTLTYVNNGAANPLKNLRGGAASQTVTIQLLT